MMRRWMKLVGLLLALALAATVVVAVLAAQELVIGSPTGGGGSGGSAGMKLVGSIPSCPAGLSTGGSYRVTGGFVAAAQVWREESAPVDAVASAPGAMISSLTAVGTRGGGAQITFALSTPATVRVQVRNIAGRMVRTVTPGRECPAGLNTVIWSGMSDAGLPAPNGMYLIEVAAQAADGTRSRALAPATVSR